MCWPNPFPLPSPPSPSPPMTGCWRRRSRVGQCHHLHLPVTHHSPPALLATCRQSYRVLREAKKTSQERERSRPTLQRQLCCGWQCPSPQTYDKGRHPRYSRNLVFWAGWWGGGCLRQRFWRGCRDVYRDQVMAEGRILHEPTAFIFGN